MIGNRLEEMSKDYLKRYQKALKLLSSTQAGTNFIWGNPDRMYMQHILKHLQYRNSAAFLNIMLKISVIFTTRKLFWMYYLNHTGAQFILFPFIGTFYMLKYCYCTPQSHFPDKQTQFFQSFPYLRFPSLVWILLKSFMSSWHTVPKMVTTLQLKSWERKDGVRELFQIGEKWIWLISEKCGSWWVRLTQWQ